MYSQWVPRGVCEWERVPWGVGSTTGRGTVPWYLDLDGDLDLGRTSLRSGFLVHGRVAGVEG